MIFGIIISVVLFIVAGFTVYKGIKKDKNKVADYTLSIILSALSILIPFIAAKFDVTTGNPETTLINSSIINSESESTAAETETFEKTTDESVTNTSEVTSIEGKTNSIIYNNTLPLDFVYENQQIIAGFKTEISGKYRFDFIISDVTCSYNVKLVNSVNETIFDENYSKYNTGITKELNKNEEYLLIVTQYNGFPNGEIKIGVPSEKSIIKLV